ncbi:MAG: glycosyltransferase family 4 protein [bacterium]
MTRSLMVVAVPPGRPCGILDYVRTLCGAWPGQSASVTGMPYCGRRTPRHRILTLLQMRRQVAAFARSLAAEVVHVQYADFGWNGVRVFEDCYEVFSSKCLHPLVITIHEHPWFRNDHEMDRPRTVADHIFTILSGYRFVPRSLPLEIMKRHRGIHVHHNWQKEALLRNGVPAEQVRVIPLAVPCCMASEAEREAFRARFGVQGKRIIGVPGFVFERKRYDRLIDLIPSLPVDVVVCALGGANGAVSERYLETLRARATQLGVEERFVVTGYLTEQEMNAGLMSASAFAAPYGEVTSSASVARCIAAGAPIVAARCATFSELAEAGAGLILADPQNMSNFTQCLTDVLCNKQQEASLRRMNASYAATWSFTAVARLMQAWHVTCQVQSQHHQQ